MNQVLLKVFGPYEGTPEIAAKIAQLLADDEPDRLEDLRDFLVRWFTPEQPGDRFTIVAEDQSIEGGPVVGVVRFWQTPYCDDIWLIEGLQVLKSRRREGIARLMEEQGLEILRQRGVESVSANIHYRNLASVQLHESLGFQKISTGATDSYGNYKERIIRYTLVLI